MNEQTIRQHAEAIRKWHYEYEGFEGACACGLGWPCPSDAHAEAILDALNNAHISEMQVTRSDGFRVYVRARLIPDPETRDASA